MAPFTGLSIVGIDLKALWISYLFPVEITYLTNNFILSHSSSKYNLSWQDRHGSRDNRETSGALLLILYFNYKGLLNLFMYLFVYMCVSVRVLWRKRTDNKFILKCFLLA